eukprot:723865-Rhodomonas_salina.2
MAYAATLTGLYGDGTDRAPQGHRIVLWSPDLSSYRPYRRTHVLSNVRVLHPEIQYKKAQFQYDLYQECRFLFVISGCYVMSGTDIAYALQAMNDKQ